MTKPAVHALNDLLAAAGFLHLGDCPLLPEDGVPTFEKPASDCHIRLIGSTGPSLWSVFKISPEFSDGLPHALDRYTKRVLSQIAATQNISVIFPFDGPPYFPFQKWAARCGGFSSSPMGVLAHETYGPWAAFRAAFITDQAGDHRSSTRSPEPCDTCIDKPCISACPAEALSQVTGYDVPRCRSHLSSDHAVACWSGCRARRACPIGQSHAQTPETGRFHMTSFINF